MHLGATVTDAVITTVTAAAAAAAAIASGRSQCTAPALACELSSSLLMPARRDENV